VIRRCTALRECKSVQFRASAKNCTIISHFKHKTERKVRHMILVRRRIVGSARLLCTFTVTESPLLAVNSGPGKPPFTRVALRVKPSGDTFPAARFQSCMTVAACTATVPASERMHAFEIQDMVCEVY
jgi:hypothetical protein